MFGIFRKKTQAEKLQAEYEKLMGEAHKLSQVNRAAGDAKYAEAQDVLDRLESLNDRT